MEKYPGWRRLDLNNGELEDVTEILISKKLETIGDFFSFYSQYLLDSNEENTAQQVTSLFVRHLVVGWGGPVPKGQRASPEEKQAALSFIETLSIDTLKDASKILETHFLANNIPKNIQSVARSRLKDMLKFATQMGIINQDKTEILYRFKEVNKSRKYIQDIKLIENRPNWAKHNMLGLLDSHYVVDELTKDQNRICKHLQLDIYLWRKCPKLFIALSAVNIYQFQPTLYLGNLRLDKELCGFIEFLITRLNHREPTAERDFLAILRYFAWLHHQKQVPLEELQIEKVIPFIKLKLRRQDFKNERGLIDINQFQSAKFSAVEEMEEITQEVLNFFNEYLDSRGISPQSKINYMKSFINLAKYVYKDETNDFKAQRGFIDISLIQKLRQRNDEFERQLSNVPDLVIPKEKRTIPWLQVLEVVEKLRCEALLEERCSVRSNRFNSQGGHKIDRIKRTKWVRSRNFQQFLILAIYTAMPPGRPREYYELEIGRTFVAGQYEDVFLFPKRR